MFVNCYITGNSQKCRRSFDKVRRNGDNHHGPLSNSRHSPGVVNISSDNCSKKLDHFTRRNNFRKLSNNLALRNNIVGKIDPQGQIKSEELHPRKSSVDNGTATTATTTTASHGLDPFLRTEHALVNQVF